MSGLVGIYGIFSIGAGIVIITGGIDLTTGSIFALQGVVLSFLLVGTEFDFGTHQFIIQPKPWPVACMLSILFVAILGGIHAFLIAKLRLQAFIVTLCGWLIYRGMARVLTGDSTCGFLLGDKETVEDSFPTLHTLSEAKVQDVFFPAGFWNTSSHIYKYVAPVLYLKMPFVIMLVIAAILWVVLHRSVYGRYLFAAGRNEDAARFSGINTVRVIGATYVLNMVLVGIAGVLDDIDVGGITPSTHGAVFELYAIAAAVLGGCSLRGGEGSIIGIVLGTILLQVLRNMVNLLGLPTQLDYVVTGGVILVAVIVDRVLAILGQRRARRAAAAASAQPAKVPQAVP
jgi:ribose transport system permease protein